MLGQELGELDPAEGDLGRLLHRDLLGQQQLQHVQLLQPGGLDDLHTSLYCQIVNSLVWLSRPQQQQVENWLGMFCQDFVRDSKIATIERYKINTLSLYNILIISYAAAFAFS